MTVRILKSEAQNLDARAELNARHLTWRDPMRGPLRPLRRAFDRLRGVTMPPVGLSVKSWDVLETVRLLERRVKRDDPIVDLGAWSSEVVVALHRARFTNLHGIDLNPVVRHMPYWWSVKYRIGDMHKTGYPAGSFAAVTAMSSMEHGHNADALFDEVVRLLRPGGLFIASTDYWPVKIDTADARMYGMSWTIFSKPELQAFLAHAATKGLEPIGALDFEAQEAPILAMNRHYTFAWLALQKAR